MIVNVETEYIDLGTTDRRALALDYIFMNHNSLVKPCEFRKFYKLNSKKFTKNISRNFYWFEQQWIIEDGIYHKDKICTTSITDTNDGKVQFSNSNINISEIYNKSYVLKTTNVKYKIPKEPLLRYNYSLLIVSLLKADENQGISQSKLNVIDSLARPYLKEFANTIIRETLFASSVYDCFYNNKNALLSIIIELSKYNQSIKLKINTNNNIIDISNTTINHIVIGENGSIELNLNNMNILLNSINDIESIFILSKKYPISNNHKIGKITKKIFIEQLNKSENITKLKEIFIDIVKDFQAESREQLNIDFDKYISDLLKTPKDNISLLDKANRRIIRD